MKAYSNWWLAIVFMALTATTLASQLVHATGLWYVAPNGDDSNDCMSTISPCATITGANMKASSGDTILVAIGTYTGTGPEVVLLDKDVTFLGGWDSNFITQSGISTIGGQDTRRGIFVNSGVTATINRFIIENGAGPTAQGGGGIFNAGGILTLIDSTVRNSSSYAGIQGGGILTRSGTLTLNNSTVTSNSANTGAGIYSDGNGAVVLNNSTVSNNTSSGQGGGIYNLASTLNLINSAVINNATSIRGGGIYSDPPATVTLTNSTVSGNSAGWDGGGIYHTGNDSSVLLNSSTVSNNNANDGGGIFTGGGVNSFVMLGNTIIAGNVASSNRDCRAPSISPTGSAGYNLIGDPSGCAFAPILGDITDIDPKLGSLQNNGGPTDTQALLPISPAIDNGNPAGCTNHEGKLLTSDQRGVLRPQFVACDIGSFEATEVAPSIASSEYFPTTPGDEWTYLLNNSTPSNINILFQSATINKIKTRVFLNSNIGSKEFYTSDSNGVRLYRMYAPHVPIQGYGVRNITLTANPPISLATASARIGQFFDTQGTFHASISGLGSGSLLYKARFSLQNSDPITVPAGTYDVVKLQGAITVEGQAPLLYTFYLARNIGIVKQEVSAFGTATARELHDTNVWMHDLAVTKIQAPKKVSLSSTKPSITKTVKVSIQNRSPHLETVNDTDMLTKLVKLQVESLGVICPAATAVLPTNKLQIRFPLELKPKKQLTVSFAVTFDCSSVSGHENFSYLATIDHSALDGLADVDPGDDRCPRSVTPPHVIDHYPDGTIKDIGCGAKKADGTYGAGIVSEVIRK